MSLKVDIQKSFGDFRLDVAFEADNETLALLGASGCGKTMTLKMIAGVEKPDAGVIELDGVTLFDSEKKIDLTPQQRHVGLMFQNYALFENMTVYRNILMGVREDRRSERAKEEVEAVMDCLHITELAQRHPSQISGGQQQRVALARIMVSHPNILMLDEPFSALDEHLRFKLETVVQDAIEDFGKTVHWVSHNRDEVYRRADRMAILDDGHLDAIGTVDEVFRDPRTPKAAALTGCKNILPAESVDETHLRLTDHDIVLAVKPYPGASQRAGEAAAMQLKPAGISHVGIRMHHIRPVTDMSDPNQLLCIVTGETRNPFSYVLDLAPAASAGRPFAMMEIEKDLWEKTRSEELLITIDPADILLLRDK